MITNELIEYIKNCREQGFSDDKIKIVLKEQGWQENDINEAFTQQIHSVESKKPKRKILVPVMIVVVVLFLGVGGFLGYKYLIKNKLENGEEQTDILAGFNLTNVIMSKEFLTRSISLEQLGISIATEKGDGALILKEFNDLEAEWSENPSDAKKKEIVEKIPDTITKISKQKNFSLFSEAYHYPKNLDTLITKEGWALVRLADVRAFLDYLGATLGIENESINSLKKEGIFWEVASSLDKESVADLMKSYLITGNKIINSNDRDYFLLLIGFGIEQKAASYLKEYYEGRGENEKANLYGRYFSEVESKKKNFSDRFDINTKLTVYGMYVFSFAKIFNVETIRNRDTIEVKNDSDVKNLFKEVASMGETSLQEQALQYMAMFWAVSGAKLEHALAGEVLRFYSEKSDSKYIRDMASEILNTNPEDLYNKLLNLIESYTEEDIEQ